MTRLQVEVSVWRIAAVGSWLLRDNRLGMNFANGTLLSVRGVCVPFTGS